MIEFVSITVHGAVTYLHILLARKLFAEPDRTFEIRVFGYMMVLFAALHTTYAGVIVAEIYDARVLYFATNLTATGLLLCTAPFFAPMMLGGLTILPKRFDLAARLLRPLAAHPRRTFFGAFPISAALMVWQFQDTGRFFDDINALVALSFMVGVGATWLAMLASGLRYDESKTTSLTKPFAIAIVPLMAFWGATVYLVDVSTIWSIIPVVSTVTYSLLIAWFRFRMQFIDVILRRCVRYVLILATVPGGYALYLGVAEQPFAAMLLAMFVYLGAAVWLIDHATTWFQRLWVPRRAVLATIHDELPPRLAACTDRDSAIAETERFLADVFRAQATINRTPKDATARVVIGGVDDAHSGESVVVHLGYIKGWMPWFSDALNVVRTAGLYLQGHLLLIAALQRLRQQALEAQELSELATKAELSAMRARIRPHFLFNTLNSIHSFVREDPVAAERTIELLADLMRGALTGGETDLCPLEKELELSRTYLEIEKMRFGERLQFAIQADVELMDLQVPIFSIQPLVENAVKYSVDSEHAAGRVDIEVATEVVTEQDRALIVRVLDDGVGLGSSIRKPASLGMAVDNVRERLRRLFGDRAALDLTSRDEGGVEARLRLPAVRISTQVQAS